MTKKQSPHFQLLNATTRLDGKQLNRNYGIIGAEQHEVKNSV